MKQFDPFASVSLLEQCVHHFRTEIAMTHALLSDDVATRRAPVAMSLLVVDDEETTRELCTTIAVQMGLRASGTASAEQALEILEQTAVDIVLVDLKLPGMPGIDLLKRIRELYPQVAVIVLTQYGSIDSAIGATRLGAADYVTKPFRIDELRNRLERAIQSVDLQQENRVLREQLHTQTAFGKFVGASEKMLRVYRIIEKVSSRNHSVLILGESGTGKELAARAVHFASPRRDRAFVPVDCSAITPTLIESELFGYVKGAFTGALHSKQGLLEAANGGTLFLDEIGDMPIELQSKLLRALQEREVKPVGSTERRQLDVRVIAATNRDLEAAVQNGTFRQDLYFRLNVVQLKLPPLRERKTDIPLLVATFLEKNSNTDDPPRALSNDALERLMAYDWPGNVRELENAIQRSVAMSSGPSIHVGDLPSNLHFPRAERQSQPDELVPLEELERRAIIRTLRETRNDKVAAAKILGIGKTTLYRKLKQYKVVPIEDQAMA